MKSIARRSVFAVVLSGILLFGLLTFVVRYFLYADRWVSFSRSPHIYVAGDEGWYPDVGKVLDRSGHQIYSTTGGISYADDALTRSATVHLLGDKAENIPALILRRYTPLLVGYDKLNGTASVDQGFGELRLTVNTQIQKVALTALGDRKGTVGVYNYKTGEILCAVTSPTFDPENVPDFSADTSGKYDAVFVNRFFRSAYTPGSIFKLVTLSAALDQVEDLESQTFTCTGSVMIGGEQVTCPKAHGTLTLDQALAKSCNCAFAQISQQVGFDAINEKVDQIGIEKTYDIDGIRTAAGNFDLSSERKNDLAWACIGQHFDLVNPCQYMMFMGAIANSGRAAVPYVVEQVRFGDRVKYLAETRWTDRMLSSQAAETLQRLMRNNVKTTYGAGNFPGLTVCAKSGTAQITETVNNATFAGFVQDEDYPLAFVVVIEEGGAGSSACVPVISQVLQACKNVMDGES